MTTRVPSGENAAQLIRASCPRRKAISLPVAASHSHAVLSSEAVMTRVPSGEKVADPTKSLTAQDSDFLAGRGVPQPRGIVIGGGDDARPVRREGGTPNRNFVAAQDSDLRARRGVPQPRGLVIGGGDDARSVRRERGAPNRIVVAAQDGDRLRRSRRPTAARSCPSRR